MFLVLSKRYSDDSRLLSEAARQRGWQIHRLQSSQVPDELLGKECRVYAEGFLVEHIATQLNLQLLRPADALLSRLPPALLQRTVRFVCASELGRRDADAFIKPADQKLFPAGIYRPEDEIPGFQMLEPTDPVLVSDVVDFQREYRFFVLDAQIMTGSVYWDGQIVPQVQVGYEGRGDELWSEARAFAQRVCDLTSELPRSCVLDIGLLASGQWAVIEFNPTWASGIYGCTPEQVLTCLEASEIKRN